MGATRAAGYLGGMQTSLRDFAPHIFALLAGGLGVSLGLTYGTRSARFQVALQRMQGWIFGVACLGLAAAGGSLAFALVRSLLTGGAADLDAVSPARLLLLGAAIGLPLGLPGVALARFDARRREAASKKRREWVPTKDDRRAYAKKIAQQIMDLSPKPRKLTARISGDGGTVLVFEGEIDAIEGERLAKALRVDLSEVGFKRVEGKDGAREWWSPVRPPSRG